MMMVCEMPTWIIQAHAYIELVNSRHRSEAGGQSSQPPEEILLIANLVRRQESVEEDEESLKDRVVTQIVDFVAPRKSLMPLNHVLACATLFSGLLR
jgi:hypothetical protein